MEDRVTARAARRPPREEERAAPAPLLLARAALHRVASHVARCSVEHARLSGGSARLAVGRALGERPGERAAEAPCAREGASAAPGVEPLSPSPPPVGFGSLSPPPRAGALGLGLPKAAWSPFARRHARLVRRRRAQAATATATAVAGAGRGRRRASAGDRAGGVGSGGAGSSGRGSCLSLALSREAVKSLLGHVSVFAVVDHAGRELVVSSPEEGDGDASARAAAIRRAAFGPSSSVTAVPRPEDLVVPTSQLVPLFLRASDAEALARQASASAGAAPASGGARVVEYALAEVYDRVFEPQDASTAQPGDLADPRSPYWDGEEDDGFLKDDPAIRRVWQEAAKARQEDKERKKKEREEREKKARAAAKGEQGPEEEEDGEEEEEEDEEKRAGRRRGGEDEEEEEEGEESVEGATGDASGDSSGSPAFPGAASLPPTPPPPPGLDPSRIWRDAEGRLRTPEGEYVVGEDVEPESVLPALEKRGKKIGRKGPWKLWADLYEKAHPDKAEDEGKEEQQRGQGRGSATGNAGATTGASDGGAATAAGASVCGAATAAGASGGGAATSATANASGSGVPPPAPPSAPLLVQAPSYPWQRLFIRPRSPTAPGWRSEALQRSPEEMGLADVVAARKGRPRKSDATGAGAAGGAPAPPAAPRGLLGGLFGRRQRAAAAEAARLAAEAEAARAKSLEGMREAMGSEGMSVPDAPDSDEAYGTPGHPYPADPNTAPRTFGRPTIGAMEDERRAMRLRDEASRRLARAQRAAQAPRCVLVPAADDVAAAARILMGARAEQAEQERLWNEAVKEGERELQLLREMGFGGNAGGSARREQNAGADAGADASSSGASSSGASPSGVSSSSPPSSSPVPLAWEHPPFDPSNPRRDPEAEKLRAPPEPDVFSAPPAPFPGRRPGEPDGSDRGTQVRTSVLAAIADSLRNLRDRTTKGAAIGAAEEGRENDTQSGDAQTPPPSAAAPAASLTPSSGALSAAPSLPAFRGVPVFQVAGLVASGERRAMTPLFLSASDMEEAVAASAERAARARGGGGGGGAAGGPSGDPSTVALDVAVGVEPLESLVARWRRDPEEDAWVDVVVVEPGALDEAREERKRQAERADRGGRAAGGGLRGWLGGVFGRGRREEREGEDRDDDRGNDDRDDDDDDDDE